MNPGGNKGRPLDPRLLSPWYLKLSRLATVAPFTSVTSEKRDENGDTSQENVEVTITTNNEADNSENLIVIIPLSLIESSFCFACYLIF